MKTEKIIVKGSEELQYYYVYDGVLSATNLEICSYQATNLVDGLYSKIGNDYILKKTDSDYPVIPQKAKLLGRVTLSSKELDFLISNTLKPTAKNTQRHLESLHFDNGNVNSTDGFRACKIQTNDFNFKKLVHIGAFKLLKPRKIYTFDFFECAGNFFNEFVYIDLVGENVSFTAKTLKYNFPNLDIMLYDCDYSLEISRKDFLEALKEIKPYAIENSNLFYLGKNFLEANIGEVSKKVDLNIRYYGKSYFDKTKSYSLIMPIKNSMGETLENVYFSCNLVQFMDLLENSNQEKIIINYLDGKKPMQINI